MFIEEVPLASGTSAKLVVCLEASKPIALVLIDRDNGFNTGDEIQVNRDEIACKACELANCEPKDLLYFEDCTVNYEEVALQKNRDGTITQDVSLRVMSQPRELLDNLVDYCFEKLGFEPWFNRSREPDFEH